MDGKVLRYDEVQYRLEVVEINDQLKNSIIVFKSPFVRLQAQEIISRNDIRIALRDEQVRTNTAIKEDGRGDQAVIHVDSQLVVTSKAVDGELLQFSAEKAALGVVDGEVG